MSFAPYKEIGLNPITPKENLVIINLSSSSFTREFSEDYQDWLVSHSTISFCLSSESGFTVLNLMLFHKNDSDRCIRHVESVISGNSSEYFKGHSSLIYKSSSWDMMIISGCDLSSGNLFQTINCELKTRLRGKPTN